MKKRPQQNVNHSNSSAGDKNIWSFPFVSLSTVMAVVSGIGLILPFTFIFKEIKKYFLEISSRCKVRKESYEIQIRELFHDGKFGKKSLAR
jgi:hypothetical protein